MSIQLCTDYSSTRSVPSAPPQSQSFSMRLRMEILQMLTAKNLNRPSRVPLSAFIVEDMTEFVQAHATYRFIILDEEEERPRLLVRFSCACLEGSSDVCVRDQIWLFKPSIRIAYMTRRHYAIPRSASMHAAKVLYKIIGPSTVPSDVKT